MHFSIVSCNCKQLRLLELVKNKEVSESSANKLQILDTNLTYYQDWIKLIMKLSHVQPVGSSDY